MIIIEEPIPEDAGEMFFVQRQTWHESFIDYIDHEEIEGRFTDSPDRIEQIKEGIEDSKNRQYFIAKDDNKIVGFISLSKKSENEIVSLYVLEQCQGQGIGSQLMQKGIKWFGEEDISIHVVQKNKKLQSFYKKFGFNFIRVLPSSISKDFEPEVELKKEAKS
jgi:ribosomal protein S18 acetylase RimI-like enzyme